MHDPGHLLSSLKFGFSFLSFSFKIFKMYVSLERVEGKEKDRERHIDV